MDDFVTISADGEDVDATDRVVVEFAKQTLVYMSLMCGCGRWFNGRTKRVRQHYNRHQRRCTVARKVNRAERDR